MLFHALTLGDWVHDNVLALGEKHDPHFILLDDQSGRTELHFDVVKWITCEFLVLLNSNKFRLLNEYSLGGSPVECDQILHTGGMGDLRFSEAA